MGGDILFGSHLRQLHVMVSMELVLMARIAGVPRAAMMLALRTALGFSLSCRRHQCVC